MHYIAYRVVGRIVSSSRIHKFSPLTTNLKQFQYHMPIDKIDLYIYIFFNSVPRIFAKWNSFRSKNRAEISKTCATFQTTHNSFFTP